MAIKTTYETTGYLWPLYYTTREIVTKTDELQGKTHERKKEETYITILGIPIYKNSDTKLMTFDFESQINTEEVRNRRTINYSVLNNRNPKDQKIIKDFFSKFN